MRIRTLVALLLLISATGACVKAGGYRRPDRTSGTCKGACEHYMACKKLENEEVFHACVLECREIFVDEGVPDTASLRDFERLACDAAVAFVEGESGRGPGEAASGPP